MPRFSNLRCYSRHLGSALKSSEAQGFTRRLFFIELLPLNIISSQMREPICRVQQGRNFINAMSVFATAFQDQLQQMMETEESTSWEWGGGRTSPASGPTSGPGPPSSGGTKVSPSAG